MSEKHVAKHRNAPTGTLRSRALNSLRRRAALGSVAVVATGLVVSAGVLSQDIPLDGAAVAAAPAASATDLSDADLADREQRASRSAGDRRPQADLGKTRSLSNASGVAVTKSADLSNADPKAIARALMPQFDISTSEFGCLEELWNRESGWNVHADNPTSSAYGIPQSLPGSKMASAGPNWQHNAETQIRWGLGYVKGRYGSACSAVSYQKSAGWY